jgi:hypothetical protein
MLFKCLFYYTFFTHDKLKLLFVGNERLAILYGLLIYEHNHMAIMCEFCTGDIPASYLKMCPAVR